MAISTTGAIMPYFTNSFFVKHSSLKSLMISFITQIVFRFLHT